LDKCKKSPLGRLGHFCSELSYIYFSSGSHLVLTKRLQILLEGLEIILEGLEVLLEELEVLNSNLKELKMKSELKDLKS